MPSARVCYVSHLDLSIPRPEQMKFNMEEVLLMRDGVAECLGHWSCNLVVPGSSPLPWHSLDLFSVCALCITNWCDSCQLSNFCIGFHEGVVNIRTYTYFIFHSSFVKYTRIRTLTTTSIFLNSASKGYLKINWVNNYYWWYFIGLFYFATF